MLNIVAWNCQIVKKKAAKAIFTDSSYIFSIERA